MLTLDDVVGLADARSETVAIAEAGVQRAEGGESLARSEWFPQLAASASYDRTLATEFAGLFDSDVSGTPCTPLQIDPAAGLDARVAELERAYACPSSSGGIFGGGSGDEDQPRLPFGRANTYRFNLSFSQNLLTGGRLDAQLRQARLGISNARLGVSAQRAQATLDAATAYYDAGLSEQVLLSAQAALEQANRTLDYTRTQREAGRVSEFDLLRAQVTRDTLRPGVIRSEATRVLALLRLQQLLDLPLEEPLQLATDLDSSSLPAPSRFSNADALAEVPPQDERLALAQVSNDLRAREADVDVARAQRRPTVAVNSGYGLVAYPSVVPAPGDFRTNWTVGASVSVPVLTGGRIRADERIARAGVEETEQRLRLTRELAALDQANATQELRASRAAWEVTAGTIQEAERAYEIADIRFTEGISTQLELSDARLLLLQARVNRAQAARDLQVARVRLALLPNLPLGAASTAAGATTGSQTGGAAVPTASGNAVQTAPRTGGTGTTGQTAQTRR